MATSRHIALAQRLPDNIVIVHSQELNLQVTRYALARVAGVDSTRGGPMAAETCALAP